MNTIRVMGGLGNQLFQYAFGKMIEEFGNTVIFDKSWYGWRHPDRPFELNKFIVDLNTTKAGFVNGILLREDNHEYIDNLPKVDNHYFDGYWQHLGYFEHLLPQLREKINLRSEYYTEDFLDKLIGIQEDKNSISLHVRRGDYLLQKGWGVLPLRYYYLALKQTRGNLYVFSDDIEYCKPLFDEGYFANRKVTFISGNAAQDFELMRACRTHIVANSTFSYWAAILDKNDPQVLCPEYWLGESKPDYEGIHYPKHWKRVQM